VGGEELFHWCMMRSAEATIMLNTEYDEGERPAERPEQGDQRFGTWFYYGCPDVDGAYEKLKAAGVRCKPPRLTMYGGKYGFRTISFRDPDDMGSPCNGRTTRPSRLKTEERHATRDRLDRRVEIGI
jgi:hypothetical protein